MAEGADDGVPSLEKPLAAATAGPGRGGDVLLAVAPERPMPKPGTDTPAAPSLSTAPWFRWRSDERDEPANGGGGLSLAPLGGSRGGRRGGAGLVAAAAAGAEYEAGLLPSGGDESRPEAVRRGGGAKAEGSLRSERGRETWSARLDDADESLLRPIRLDCRQGMAMAGERRQAATGTGKTHHLAPERRALLFGVPAILDKVFEVCHVVPARRLSRGAVCESTDVRRHVSWWPDLLPRLLVPGQGQAYLIANSHHQMHRLFPPSACPRDHYRLKLIEPHRQPNEVRLPPSPGPVPSAITPLV